MAIAIVTGGAGAIGSAICRALAARGDRVICGDVNEAAFAQAFSDTDAEIRSRIEFAALDVTDETAWKTICDHAEEGADHIATLVNCAFSSVVGPIDALDHEAWRSNFDVTLHGAALGIQTAGNRMANSGSGAIINLSSVVAHSGAPMNAGYATAKAAILGLTRTSAARLGRKGVRVNAISPGWVDTPPIVGLFQRQAREGRTVEQVRASLEKRIPLQRLAEPADIADIVAFLSSDAARYVTGIELIADGGLSVA